MEKMLVPKPKKEFVGSGEPRNILETNAKELAERAAAVEQRAEKARRDKDLALAKELEKEHQRLMAEQRGLAKEAAKAKEYKLENLNQ